MAAQSRLVQPGAGLAFAAFFGISWLFHRSLSASLGIWRMTWATLFPWLAVRPRLRKDLLIGTSNSILAHYIL
jgi:hypothetical protein